MNKLVTVVILCLLSCFAIAQVNSTPESAMLSYTAATRSWDAERMAKLMHPEALRRFREAFNAAFLGERSAQARTDLLPLFAVSTYEDYVALSNVEAYQRLNEVIARSSPQLAEIMANTEYEMIGQVQSGDAVFVTYVLAVPVEGRVVRKQVVQELKQHEGSWLLMLPPDGEATIARLDAQY